MTLTFIDLALPTGARRGELLARALIEADYKGQLVFCEPNGSSLQPHLVSKTIVRRLRRAGTNDASLHTCARPMPAICFQIAYH